MCHTRADLQFVLAGDLALLATRETNRANALVLPSAPQLTLIRAADVVVTHAGLNTVKECIMCRTPMVAVPLTDDQPANGFRVARNLLGVTAHWDVTGEAVADLIDEVRSEPTYAAAIEDMRRTFEAERQADTVSDLVRRFLL